VFVAAVAVAPARMPAMAAIASVLLVVMFMVLFSWDSSRGIARGFGEWERAAERFIPQK
jgi:hypothetical protein